LTPRRLEVPRITVDFSDVQEFEALDKGEYLGVISKAEYRDFPDEPDRYPYINLEIDVTEPPDLKGRKLWSVLSFSPKALWRMKQVFENLDIFMDEMEFDVDEETNMVVSPELVGIPVLCAVSKRIYEGREQNQIDSITSPDGSAAPKKRSTSTSPTRTKSAAKSAAGSGSSKRKFK
jgi:hypothetical protein